MSTIEEDISQAETQLAKQKEEFVAATKPKGLTLKEQARLQQQVGSSAVQRAFKKTEQAKIEARQKFIPQFSEARRELTIARSQIAEQKGLIVEPEITPTTPEQARLVKLDTQISKQQALIKSHNETISKYQKIERTTTDRDKRERAIIEQQNSRKLLVRVANEFDRLSRERGLLIASGSLQEFAIRESIRQRQSLAESLARAPPTPSAREIQIEKFRAEGLDPIFVGGELKGFGLAGTTTDIPVSALGLLPQEKIAALEERGLITFEPSTSQLIPTSQLPLDSKFIAQEKPKLIPGLLDVLAGQKGAEITGFSRRGFVIGGIGGIGILPTISKPEEVFSLQELGQIARQKGGIAGGVFDVILPKTPLGVGVFVATPIAITKLPKIGQALFGAGIGILGTKTAIDPALPTEERIAGGLVGGLGLAGATFTTLPFVKGGLTKFSPKFAKVTKAPEGFSEIKFKDVEIGLILEKAPAKTGITTEIKLPPESPLVKGGFGRRPGGEEIFLGRDQFLATSQLSFFKTGKDIPLLREFFGTPAEPFIGVGETRLSRLGLSDLFKFTKDVEFGFGVPKQPQIGITKADVGRVETGTQFKIGTGTELEAIKTTGTITEVKKIGVTVIKGQRVDIFEFKIGDGKIKVPKIDLGKRVSTRPTTQISAEISLSAFGLSSLISGRTRITTRITDTFLTKPSISPRTFITELPTTPISPIISPPLSPPITTTPSPPISPPIISPPTISPPTISPPFLPLTPPKPLPRRRRAKRKKVKVKKKKKKRITPIRPSFTAIVAELRGKFPKISPRVGVSPLDIRLLPSKKRKKGTKRKSRSLTDL